MLELIWKGLVVFGLTLVVSVMWALYFHYSTEGKAHRAGLADVGIVGVGMVNLWSWMHDPRMAIPVLAGTYVGTVIAIKRKAHTSDGQV